jgi:hypothetical protein
MSIGRRHEVVALQQLHLTAVLRIEPAAAETPTHRDDHNGVPLRAKRDNAPLPVTGPEPRRRYGVLLVRSQAEHLDRPSVPGRGQEPRVVGERQAVHLLRRVGEAGFLQQLAVAGVEDPDVGAAHAGRGHQPAVLRQREGREARIRVRVDEHRPPLVPGKMQALHPHLSLARAGAGQHPGSERRQGAQAPQVRRRLVPAPQPQVGEAEYGDAGLVDDGHAVAEDADAAKVGAAAKHRQHAGAAAQAVVPHKHLPRVGIAAAANEGEAVGPEQHLHGPDAASARMAPPEFDEVPAGHLKEAVAVVYAEAARGAGGEAAAVLVEGDVEEPVCACWVIGDFDGAEFVIFGHVDVDGHGALAQLRRR